MEQQFFDFQSVEDEISHLFGLTAISVLFIRNVSELPMAYRWRNSVQCKFHYCGENFSFLSEICCFSGENCCFLSEMRKSMNFSTKFKITRIARECLSSKRHQLASASQLQTDFHAIFCSSKYLPCLTNITYLLTQITRCKFNAIQIDCKKRLQLKRKKIPLDLLVFYVCQQFQTQNDKE